MNDGKMQRFSHGTSYVNKEDTIRKTGQACLHFSGEQDSALKIYQTPSSCGTSPSLWTFLRDSSKDEALWVYLKTAQNAERLHLESC